VASASHGSGGVPHVHRAASGRARPTRGEQDRRDVLAHAELGLARDHRPSLHVDEATGHGRHVVDRPRVVETLGDVGTDVRDEPGEPGGVRQGAEPAPDRGEDALALAEPAVRVVNGELTPASASAGIASSWRSARRSPSSNRRISTSISARAATGVIPRREPLAHALDEFANALIGDDPVVAGHVAVGVLRDRGLRDAERVGDLVLGEAALAEVLRQHRAHRREELVDDDLLDEPHDSCSAAWFSSL